MVISLIRSIILYTAIIVTVRIMGKRQLSQLQPVELVITIMISQVAVFPLENKDTPLLTSLQPFAVFLCLEIFSSVINMKSLFYRTLVQGHSVIIIRNGVIDQKMLKNLRMTVDDVLEALRKRDIFDIDKVAFALLETDGTVTALLKSENKTVTVKDEGLPYEDSVLKYAVICDGKIIKRQLEECNLKKKDVIAALNSRRLELKDVLLMTADGNGKTEIIERDRQN
ncbi:MAG: DUF421 domain-containing protein [Clostridiales bacterium]|nr:DUF421 domain-containing protein [Clostridia bacterium]MCR4564024.1 DUF421 domain-containing protein [Clostridiales bacterium]